MCIHAVLSESSPNRTIWVSRESPDAQDDLALRRPDAQDFAVDLPYLPLILGRLNILSYLSQILIVHFTICRQV